MNRVLFMLDSGAYSVGTLGGSVDLEKYARFIVENKKSFTGGIFTLDDVMDAEKSYENWIRLRALGVETIPVYHHGEPVKFLFKYLDACDYIGIGGVASQATPARLVWFEHFWKDHLIKPSGEPVARLHGLGMTSIELMLRYPWYSLDSSSAVKQAAFGNVFLPRFTKGEPDYSDLTSLAVSAKSSRHKASSNTSFYSLPTLAQRPILQCLSRHGFEIAQSVERGIGDLSLFGGGIKESESGGTGENFRNVALNWRARFEWNLIMIHLFSKHHRVNGSHLRIYNVISGAYLVGEVARIMARTNFVHRYLVSYYRMGKSVQQRVKEALHGNGSGAPGQDSEKGLAGGGIIGNL